MPFIPKEKRKKLFDYVTAPELPGEFCYLEYRWLMDAWNKDKRWTTIHNEAKRVLSLNDVGAAKFLAFLEFYFNHGHKYEVKMKRKNGDIK